MTLTRFGKACTSLLISVSIYLERMTTLHSLEYPSIMRMQMLPIPHKKSTDIMLLIDSLYLKEILW
jgi:hypothetical protein